MRIISFTNQKGGVAKSTSTINIGAILGQMGRSVLVVDIDPQANTTVGLAVDGEDLASTIYECLTGTASLEEAITKTEFKNVDLAVTSQGTDVANFSIAVTKYRDKKSGKWIADYFDCVAWKNLAVNISKSIKKGTRVILSGKIENQSWEDNEGTRRKNTRITVFNLGVDLSFVVCGDIKKNKAGDDSNISNEGEEFEDKEVSRFSSP